jgi:hypothetical protein
MGQASGGSIMNQDSPIQNRERLILLIRKIVREAAGQASDKHLEDYEHKEKQALEVQGE